MSGKPGRVLKDFGMILVRSARDPGGAPGKGGELLWQGWGNLCTGGRESSKGGGKNIMRGGRKEDCED